MSDFVQTAFNFDVRQDTDLSDFESAGFRPLMNAINEILSGNLRELFIVGRRGFGKTHLAMAMHRYLSAHKKTVINLSLNDLISSGADGSALLGLETFDVIIIDDFQAVTSSRAWQENLFDLINRVRDQKKQMVYLATAPAKELGIGLLDLTTRLSLAPTFRLPNNEDIKDRQAMLNSVLRRKNWRLPEPIYQHLLTAGPYHAGGMLDILDKISPMLTSLPRVHIPKKTIDEVKQLIEKETLLLEIHEND